MTILAVTHAGRFNYANPKHTEDGISDLYKVKNIVLDLFFSKKEELHSIGTGVGYKYEEILRLFIESKIFVPAEKIILCPYLGGTESAASNGSMVSSSGSVFQKYIGLGDTKCCDFWGLLEEKFSCDPNEVVILCTGKQFLKALGKEAYFNIASVYELLPGEKSIVVRVKMGKLLKKPIIG